MPSLGRGGKIIPFVARNDTHERKRPTAMNCKPMISLTRLEMGLEDKVGKEKDLENSTRSLNFLVAGAGFEPTTFGLWVGYLFGCFNKLSGLRLQRAAKCDIFYRQKAPHTHPVFDAVRLTKSPSLTIQSRSRTWSSMRHPVIPVPDSVS